MWTPEMSHSSELKDTPLPKFLLASSSPLSSPKTLEINLPTGRKPLEIGASSTPPRLNLILEVDSSSSPTQCDVDLRDALSTPSRSETGPIDRRISSPFSEFFPADFLATNGVNLSSLEPEPMVAITNNSGSRSAIKSDPVNAKKACGNNNKEDAREVVLVVTPEGNYVCSVCSFTADDRETFMKHKRKHAGAKAHVCALCSSGFTRRSTLDKHIRQKHVSSTTASLPKYCPFSGCSYVTRNANALAMHKKTHIRSTTTAPRFYFCKACPAVKYSSRRSILMHLTLNHGSDSSLFGMAPGDPEIPGGKKGKKGSKSGKTVPAGSTNNIRQKLPFSAGATGRSQSVTGFNNGEERVNLGNSIISGGSKRGSLTVETESPVKRGRNWNGGSQSGRGSNQTTPEPAKLPAPSSQQLKLPSATKRRGLLSGMPAALNVLSDEIFTASGPKTISKEAKKKKNSFSEPKRTYECDKCSYSTRTFQALYSHRKRTHGANQRDGGGAKNLHSCMFCRKKFPQTDRLLNHIKRTHISTKSSKTRNQYVCKYCDFTTTTKRVFTAHKKMHQTEDNSTDRKMTKTTMLANFETTKKPTKKLSSGQTAIATVVSAPITVSQSTNQPASASAVALSSLIFAAPPQVNSQSVSAVPRPQPINGLSRNSQADQYLDHLDQLVRDDPISESIPREIEDCISHLQAANASLMQLSRRKDTELSQLKSAVMNLLRRILPKRSAVENDFVAGFQLNGVSRNGAVDKILADVVRRCGGSI